AGLLLDQAGQQRGVDAVLVRGGGDLGRVRGPGGERARSRDRGRRGGSGGGGRGALDQARGALRGVQLGGERADGRVLRRLEAQQLLDLRDALDGGGDAHAATWPPRRCTPRAIS